MAIYYNWVKKGDEELGDDLDLDLNLDLNLDLDLDLNLDLNYMTFILVAGVLGL